VHGVVGLDIGGANLKAVHTARVARLQPFELWKDPAGLSTALRQLLAELPAYDLLAVTMTGELCDCFATKREGVLAILQSVEEVAAGTPVRIWQTDGQLVDVETARANPLLAASANWLALATFAGRFAKTEPALLIDIGSTTTDIVPLHNGQPVPRGRTDQERLAARELVYTGVRRTPLCALLGPDCAAEVFATTLDAYLVLESLPEDSTDRRTADGRAATKAKAHARLARMICADPETCSEDDTWALALRVRSRQINLLRSAIDQVQSTLPGRSTTAVLAGSGEFLAHMALSWYPSLDLRPISMAKFLKPAISEAACAYAVAVLARKTRHVN
jgi:probable H4MPT-linked C1 transfer pathway protein